jgi:hypothetical protein
MKELYNLLGFVIVRVEDKADNEVNLSTPFFQIKCPFYNGLNVKDLYPKQHAGNPDPPSLHHPLRITP